MCLLQEKFQELDYAIVEQLEGGEDDFKYISEKLEEIETKLVLMAAEKTKKEKEKKEKEKEKPPAESKSAPPASPVSVRRVRVFVCDAHLIARLSVACVVCLAGHRRDEVPHRHRSI